MFEPLVPGRKGVLHVGEKLLDLRAKFARKFGLGQDRQESAEPGDPFIGRVTGLEPNSDFRDQRGSLGDCLPQFL